MSETPLKEELQCYNRSCGQTFNPSSNTSESCLHHPGIPVFHDVYKKWSCCSKKTTDFTEFLDIKGCTRSYHSNIKPVETPKVLEKDKTEDVEVRCMPKPLKQKEVTVRPDCNLPLRKLTSSVGASLKPLLEKLKTEVSSENKIGNDSAIIALNTPCQNGGCRGTYKGEQSNEETCIYHSGVPIFHEGMKYWSCCVKRTTDFDSFLEQVGCTTGTHKWHKEKKKEERTSCRYDWHQTGNSVVVSVFSKCPFPDLSCVEVNPVKLHIHIVFGQERDVFDQEIVLFGIIDVDSCKVTYLGSKVEIFLKKGEPISWKELALQKTILNIKSISLEEQ